ncbi:MAG: universal stress protein [Pseudonocardia sp.]|nr:universal stress protein [Pseudonocardia sp.]
MSASPEGTARADEIVVGVDTSTPSRAALRWALREADGTGRVVRAVLVWNPAPLFAGPAPAYEPIGPVRAEYRAELERAVAEVVGPRPPVGVTTEVLEGDPADELARRADGAALLVLGSHGRGRLRATFLGSVALGCVRHATCPVLIIPPALAGRAEAPAPVADAVPTPQVVGS